MTRLTYRGALAVVALTTLSAPACAHVTLERGTAAVGATYRAVRQINHGCGDAATTAVRVRVPDGVVGARAMPGWTLATVIGPVTQESGATIVRWDEVPAAGAARAAGTSPASGVVIVAAAASADTMAGMHDILAMNVAAPADGSTIKHGDLTIDTPWMRATPGGAKVAGGYVKVTNTGAEADRLVGATMPLAGHGEVHEMSVVNGVMHMAPVEGGILIKPGESIELRPGGYHLMFMDLTGPAKEGDTQKGTLLFQRAGAVEVTFRVGGLGAMRAPAARP